MRVTTNSAKQSGGNMRYIESFLNWLVHAIFTGGWWKI